MSAQARPQDYAAAIYDLAFEAWIRQLQSVQTALNRDTSLRSAIQDPGRPVKDRLERLARAVTDGLAPDVRSFLGTLLEAGQIDQLEAIVAEFERLVQRHPERKPAKVVTAVPLTDAEKAALEASVTGNFGSGLEFEYEIDRSVIGGVYLRVGDRVIDGTIAGKLAALRDQLVA